MRARICKNYVEYIEICVEIRVKTWAHGGRNEEDDVVQFCRIKEEMRNEGYDWHINHEGRNEVIGLDINKLQYYGNYGSRYQAYKYT